VGGGRSLGGGYIEKNKTGTKPGGTKREHFYLVNQSAPMARDTMSQPCALFEPQFCAILRPFIFSQISANTFP